MLDFSCSVKNVERHTTIALMWWYRYQILWKIIRILAAGIRDLLKWFALKYYFNFNYLLRFTSSLFAFVAMTVDLMVSLVWCHVTVKYLHELLAKPSTLELVLCTQYSFWMWMRIACGIISMPTIAHQFKMDKYLRLWPWKCCNISHKLLSNSGISSSRRKKI